MNAHDDVPLYRNPIIDADWPDPDACRVGDEFFLICSSFNRSPGLPVLRSRDLVNWEHVAHALPANVPEEWYRLPRHGAGVWAPAIRHHDGMFHIVYPDVERGILVVSAPRAEGPWSAPRMLLEGLGIIDPCPLWDDDGKTYLVHGWAGSRAGRKNVLTVVPVDAALTTVTGPARDVIDGDALEGYRTLEGPKFYRRDGWYWIFAPAGGVAEGWQAVFRARSPYGPYEERRVLAQGSTRVNGPHQGAWVDAPDGSSHWFLHFQDRGVFGRVLHLQPMAWGEDGWPVFGAAVAGGAAEPVIEHPTPFGTSQGPRTRAVSDDFRSGLAPAWSWQANPAPEWAATGADGLTLRGVPDDAGNVRTLPHVLTQPLPGMPSQSTTDIRLVGPPGARAGLVILGRAYVWAGLRLTDAGPRFVVATREDGGLHENLIVDEAWPEASITLRVVVDADAGLVFHAGTPSHLRVVASGLTATAGHWIGADVGLFAGSPIGAEAATAVVDRFDIEVDGGQAHGDQAQP